MYMAFGTVSVAMLNNVLISHVKSSFENYLVLTCVYVPVWLTLC